MTIPGQEESCLVLNPYMDATAARFEVMVDYSHDRTSTASRGTNSKQNYFTVHGVWVKEEFSGRKNLELSGWLKNLKPGKNKP